MINEYLLFFFILQASIPSKQLTLALEPECAAIYVLTRAKLKLSSKQLEKTVCDPGEKYLVADLGGTGILLRYEKKIQ